ncbi:polysaccharide lyase family 7 protein [Pendulispora rubella]|uniref:Polysaccharide lyase family 7 protein n=1 Tax=Pendulispora rubella TaxID=2741070 RepID=A0ABZ2LGC7_9BACT
MNGRWILGLGALLLVGCSGEATGDDVPLGEATEGGEAALAGEAPAKVLDLTNWKVTLPTGSSEKPKEVTQPSLATFSVDPYFKVNPAGNGVQFRAPTNGVTTSGSGYPRSELREMKAGGKSNASWSTSSGTHTMIIDEAITAVPKKKKHVVAGQIHDANDDVIVIRLEFPKLFVDINGDEGPTLDANYVLGKRFTVKFVASAGKIKIYYNDASSPAYTLSKKTSGCYFKAGAYTQSNCDKEDSCGASNYGEVNIYGLKVTHQ